MELAQMLERDLTTRYRHAPVYAEGDSYAYEAPSGLWKPIDGHVQSMVVQGYAGLFIPNEDGEMKPMRVSASTVRGVRELARDRMTRPDFFASAAEGIAFANGFVTVTADGIALRRHAPEHRARQGFAFAFTADAPAHRFGRFLESLFEGDTDAAEKIRVLGEFFGASLIGAATRFQRALIAVGEGANGKSTILNVMADVMPLGSVVSIAPHMLERELTLIQLAGKRLNIVTELPAAKLAGSEVFKATITGDPVTGRRIGANATTFRPVAGQVFAANQLPQVDDTSAGFWRRFIVLTFNRRFEGGDAVTDLREQIVEHERAGILVWMLQGARRALARGRYEDPSSSRKALESWRTASNPVAMFLAECTRSSAETWTKASALYEAYRAWCTANGHTAVASNAFGARARALGAEAAHRKGGNVYALALVSGDEGDGP